MGKTTMLGTEFPVLDDAGIIKLFKKYEPVNNAICIVSPRITQSAIKLPPAEIKKQRLKKLQEEGALVVGISAMGVKNCGIKVGDKVMIRMSQPQGGYEEGGYYMTIFDTNDIILKIK